MLDERGRDERLAVNREIHMSHADRGRLASSTSHEACTRRGGILLSRLATRIPNSTAASEGIGHRVERERGHAFPRALAEIRGKDVVGEQPCHRGPESRGVRSLTTRPVRQSSTTRALQLLRIGSDHRKTCVHRFVDHQPQHSRCIDVVTEGSTSPRARSKCRGRSRCGT